MKRLQTHSRAMIRTFPFAYLGQFRVHFAVYNAPEPFAVNTVHKVVLDPKLLSDMISLMLYGISGKG